MNAKLLFLPFSIILALWLVISPVKNMWTQYKSTKNEVIDLQKTKDKLDRGMRSIRKAVGEFQGLDKLTVDYLNNAMPQLKDDDNFVAEINKNAKQSGVLVTKIDISENSQGAMMCSKGDNVGIAVQNISNNNLNNCSLGVKQMEVVVDLSGTYLAVKDFIAKMDSQNRLVEPVQLLMSEEKNSGESDEEKTNNQGEKIINAKLQMNIFYRDKSGKVNLSEAMDRDPILKSLLNKGLKKDVIDKVRQVITSDIFIPVKVGAIGKENLFAETQNAE